MQVKDKTVAYYYDEELGNVNYGGGNPMRPHRVRLTHNLVENYGLKSKLRVQRPRYCTDRDLEEFHADGELLQAGKALLWLLRCVPTGCCVSGWCCFGAVRLKKKFIFSSD